MKTYVLAAVLVFATLAAHAQQRPEPIDVTRLGPQVGGTVPDFRLQDSQGKVWTRDTIMGPKGAMLVFSRSLDWCPYCKTQATDLQRRVAELRAHGLGLAVITYDQPSVLADFQRRRAITFPLLSDPGSRTIRSFGILNTTVDAASSSFGIPFPGTFIVNRQGVVTARFFETAFQERTTLSSILVGLGSGGGSGPAAAERASTDHLELTSYASDAVVAPGALFSLVFDVRLRDKMHVYAPGATGYKVISFTMEPNPLLVSRPMTYPPSEIYFFEPLNERVPVFQKPFRLTQAMSLSTAPEHRQAVAGMERLTIRGTLAYQACDDRTCFTPRSIPVSVSVGVRALDTERARVPAATR